MVAGRVTGSCDVVGEACGECGRLTRWDDVNMENLLCKE